MQNSTPRTDFECSTHLPSISNDILQMTSERPARVSHVALRTRQEDIQTSWVGSRCRSKKLLSLRNRL
jgi:hypothetical protein